MPPRKPAGPADRTDQRCSTDWQDTPLIKARLAGGYCLRTAAQGACAYANICEHCPSFRNDPAFLPVLAAQRADTEALLADAESRGWATEAARHRKLAERLDLLITQAQAVMSRRPRHRVEQACQHLLTSGKALTIARSPQRSASAAPPSTAARTAGHRPRAPPAERDAFTLTGLAVQIDQLRQGLEALAAKVRRHEEQLRRPSRQH